MRLFHRLPTGIATVHVQAGADCVAKTKEELMKDGRQLASRVNIPIHPKNLTSSEVNDSNEPGGRQTCICLII